MELRPRSITTSMKIWKSGKQSFATSIKANQLMGLAVVNDGCALGWKVKRSLIVRMGR